MNGSQSSPHIDRVKAALIFVVAFAVYLLTRSPFLDEWDSVQFALGVREFNLWKHQPHPPGYPVYVFVGWLGSAVARLDPATVLHIVSCAGGALFVTAWFGIVRLYFADAFALLVAATVGITSVVWMTSTQVLTDMPAAGVLSAELLCAVLYERSGGVRHLIGAALLGAAATGVRPQLILVAAVILVAPLRRRRAPARLWLIATGTLVGACFLWLAPTAYLQAKLTPGMPAWLVYPKQLYGQWQWRLDKPQAYIGAGDFTPKYLGLRFGAHILGWFGVGFGLLRSAFALALGGLISLGGLAIYVRHLQPADREFWREHRAWALLHIAIIFCCLPANQRYYLIIVPLLVIAIQRGLLQLPQRWRPAVFLLPVLLLSISIPLALDNHRDAPPPIKMIRYLEANHAAAERKQVVLLMRECERHVEWYAPEFTNIYVVKFPPATIDPQLLADAKAIYTDDAKLPLLPGWRLVRVVEFSRSLLIEKKQRNVVLFRVERTPPS